MLHIRFSFLLYLSLIFNLAISTPAKALEEIDSIAIIVNDEVITHQQIENRFNDFKKQIQLQGQSLPDDELLKKQVIERMIIDSIQLQMAKLQGISLDDLSLNQALESIAQNNNTTLDGLRRTLTSKGISYENFREQTRRDIVIQQLQQRVIYSTVKVSPQEIDIFLEQQKQSGDESNDKYHLAHILIATPEAASPEEVSAALNKAKQAIERIQQGDKFSDVALRFSDGRHALQGGDLEWRSAAELPPLFLNTARQLEKGEISSPLRSAGGFHVLKLIDKQTQNYLVKQTLARHILIKTDQIISDDEARDTLLTIKQRLNKGEDFATLAEEFSQDPGSKNKGGDLGWSSEGSFVPRFTQVMNSLDKGQISEPFKSQFGWHIIQVLDRRQQDETEQRIRQKAEMAIQKRKADEELQLWLRRSRDEAYVEFANESKD